ncbi:MOSC domain-containing protein YiiM [Asanoa hainanensis]|uniref:MOSC domain-containing protein YiiM n=1 Tax=Asanoa hainanensis TaxID=560556 RepID=A0A239MF36_9ACTN|nr:MOSC domain-containing protein [Asanoa hainanensis]SNT40409.1 MOSC domain-containing protein YiiM [Asanoa hainanensis]
MTGRVLSVNTGSRKITGYADGPGGQTGIDKQPTIDRVTVSDAGVDGDYIGNRRVHGSPDQAVYAYAVEDARWWADELGRELWAGAFGENLTTEGVDVTDALVGERWAIGSAIVQVTKPREPCKTFAGFWGVPDLIKRFTNHAAPGAYFRVVTPGQIGADDTIEVIHRPDHDVTIGRMFRAFNGQPELLPSLLAATDIPEPLLAKIRRRVRARS